MQKVKDKMKTKTTQRIWDILQTLNDTLEGFKPSDLKYLQAEMNEILKIAQEFEDKIHRRNMQITDLKKRLSALKAQWQHDIQVAVDHSKELQSQIKDLKDEVIYYKERLRLEQDDRINTSLKLKAEIKDLKAQNALLVHEIEELTNEEYDG